MRHYAILTTVMGLFLLMTATEALAHCGKCGRGGGRQVRQDGDRSGCTFGPRMTEQLKLTTEQQNKVDALRDKMDKDNEPVIKKLDALRSEMRKLWLADKPSGKAILKQQKKMTPLREKLRTRRVRFKLDALALLSPEQKAQFKDFVKSRKDRPGRGRGHRGRCWRDDNY